MRHSEQATVHGLYLHVPFCFHKCHYCDFYSVVEADRLGQSRHRLLVDRMIAELEARQSQCRLTPRTLFVGGGTPTLLAVDAWRVLLDGMKRLRLLDELAEFTVEANPETVTEELIDALTAGGVNRLSIGAQSFDPIMLKTLERWHDPANVGRSVAVARTAGINNISVDLIFAIPGQTVDGVLADLDQALSLEVDHISVYNLTYEPNTAMTQRLKMGQFEPLDEDTERAMYAAVIERLDQAGFEQYEISNWQRRDPHRDLRSQHNLIYWRGENWLGVGPGAASHIEGHRWKNQPSISGYLASTTEPPITDAEHLSDDDRVGEHLMMRLRLTEGVPTDWLAANVPTDSNRGRELASLLEIGMLERTNSAVRLTREGLFVADAVVGRLL